MIRGVIRSAGRPQVCRWQICRFRKAVGGMRYFESVSGLCCEVLVTGDEVIRNRQ